MVSLKTINYPYSSHISAITVRTPITVSQEGLFSGKNTSASGHVVKKTVVYSDND